MDIDVRVDGLPALQNQLNDLMRRQRRTVKRLVEKHTQRGWKMARKLVPVRTGFLYNSIEMAIAEDGLSGVFGPNESHFNSAGFDFYAIYVEFGTSLMAAQPFMTPAYRRAQEEFPRDLEEGLRADIKAASGNFSLKGFGK